MLIPPRTAGIYEIRNLVTGEFYVGSSITLRQRFSRHRSQLRHGRHGNPRLQRAWNKYGADAFVIRPLAVLEKDEAMATEERLLAIVVGRPDCYNICRHVDTVGEWTPERREAVSLRTAGKKFGPLTPERRAAISAAAKLIMQDPDRRARNAEHIRRFAGQNKGKPLSDEQRAKMSAAMKGRTAANKGVPHSAETRAKIAAKALGRKMSEAQRAKCRERRASDETRAKMRAAHLARHAALRLARAVQP